MAETIITPQYRPVSADLFMQRTEEAQSRVQGFEFWKPKSAPSGQPPFRNMFRIMPAHLNMVDDQGRAEPFVIVKMHFSLGPSQNITSPCREFFNVPCPADSWIRQLMERAAATDDPNAAKQIKDMAYKMRPQWRVYTQIVDRNAIEKGVQTYAFGTDVEKKIRPCFFNDSQQFRDITDPNTGRWVIMDVVKKPKTDYNEYAVKASEENSKLDDMKWLEQIRDLTSYKFLPSFEDIQGALQGKRIERSPKTVSLPGVPVPGALPAASSFTPPTAAAAAARPVAVPVPSTAPAPAPVPATAAPAPAPPMFWHGHPKRRDDEALRSWQLVNCGSPFFQPLLCLLQMYPQKQNQACGNWRN